MAWTRGEHAARRRRVQVLAVSDKASAREAIYKIAQQGEGPADDVDLDTHFDRFLRLYREFRAYAAAPDAPAFVRHQASDPTTQPGPKGEITDTKSLEWARLANTRYVILLTTIALSFSLGTSGTVPGTTARRGNLITWSFAEMKVSLTRLGVELQAMALADGAGPNDLRAGLPFELPADRDLPTSPPEQLLELRATDRRVGHAHQEHPHGLRTHAKADRAAQGDRGVQHHDAAEDRRR